MKKKILLVATVATLALLLPFMIAVLPLQANKPYPIGTIGPIRSELIDEGEVWVADGILHMRNSYWKGPYRQQWVKHLSLNLETGEGTFSVKWLTTTLDGTPIYINRVARGKITDWFYFSGTYECHGTGTKEGWKARGSFWGETEGYNEGDVMKIWESPIINAP